MSRQIDTTEKLSDEDRHYLMERGKEQLVLQNDAQFSDDPDLRAAADYIPGTSIDVADGVPHTPDADPLVVNGGGLVQGFPPEEFRTGVGPTGNEGDGVDGDGAQGSELSEDEDPGYEGWKKKALLSEIDKRNATYTEEYQISKAGTIAELAERLREDDRENEEDDEDDEQSDESTEEQGNTENAE